MPEPLRCSGNLTPGDPCTRPAVYVYGIHVGSWLLGAWACEECAKRLEEEFPVFYTKEGKPRPIPQLGSLIRDPQVLTVHELRGQPAIRRDFTCDRCGQPISRRDGKWVHTSTDPDHEGIPG